MENMQKMVSTPIMSQQRLIDLLTRFIMQEILLDEKTTIKPDTPLLQTGILNSLGIISLLTFIETELRVTIPVEDVLPQNFMNIQTIAQLIEKTENLP